MSHSVLYIPSVFRHKHHNASEKPELRLSREEFLWPVIFLVCMSLTGLHIYPAILGCFVAMLKTFRTNRYDFALMVFFLSGGYGLMPVNLFPLKVLDLTMLCAVGFAIILRKTPVMRRALVLYLLYVVAYIWIATYSWESMRTQFLVLRFYFGFIVVFVFIGCFANHSFELRRMVRSLMVFLVVICSFYIIDGLILKGPLLLPEATGTEAATISTLRLHPFWVGISRVYPPGLYFIPLAIVPAMRMYKLPKWVWVLVLVSALVTMTFTYITAFAAVLILFQGSWKRFGLICLVVVAGGLLLYGIDCLLPKRVSDFHQQSSLRIQSTVEQFFDLANAMDDEDISEFGSGRMAQAIPKLELVSLYHKEWTGLGFLHKDYTTNARFIIDNEYYSDVTKSEEISTGIEIIPMQIYVSGGWAALIVINLFLFGLWFNVRKLRNNYIYLATLVFVMVMGVGGFAGVNTYPGNQLLAFAYAMVVLSNRKEEKELEK